MRINPALFLALALLAPFSIQTTRAAEDTAPKAAASQVTDEDAATETDEPHGNKPRPTRRLVFKKTTDAAGQPVELKLHIFEPTGHKATDKTPVVVFFFGGGWNSGRPNTLFPHSAYFASRGIVAIAADYRVYKRQKTTPFECVADGKSAIRYVRSHAAELGIDPNRIVASGTSAGGHVAASTAIIVGHDEKGEDTKVSSSPNASVLYNPVIDDSPAGFVKGRKVDRWQEISPLHSVRPGLLPTIVFHGDADKTVSYASVVAFNAAMKQAGNRSELVTFPGAGHGFFPRWNQPLAQRAVRETDIFLASLSYLQGAPTLTPAPK